LLTSHGIAMPMDGKGAYRNQYDRLTPSYAAFTNLVAVRLWLCFYAYSLNC
jgi:hypothetical protein